MVSVLLYASICSLKWTDSLAETVHRVCGFSSLCHGAWLIPSPWINSSSTEIHVVDYQPRWLVEELTVCAVVLHFKHHPTQLQEGKEVQVGGLDPFLPGFLNQLWIKDRVPPVSLQQANLYPCHSFHVDSSIPASQQNTKEPTQNTRTWIIQGKV